jgi:hypothetical protein
MPTCILLPVPKAEWIGSQEAIVCLPDPRNVILRQSCVRAEIMCAG